ncbi:hypothetical protein K490DRAFT_51244 [Saccharata proteae CBS 121410]|uniref:Cryptic loci regulator 2 N-terminal domain-containing protein n=1 Tax=Saccharata proteae CBS 121410 TaxID=1314787 RepID=A0A9P4LU07_9PEZI|nr:hypothetical protein K490DRAFT_51244 [Saccharata proteae CBS 121410]
MARYHAFYVARSDGTLETTHARKTERNEPTPDQLDRTPDANGVRDYYREIPEDEQKHIDWRRKLGGMLMREIGKPEEQHKGCILAALPENYRLYEHIKQSQDGDKKSAKNHAGGGHDRQDAYLYGHPQGRKKRFRSPADYFPHLLWLVTDADADPNNCTCKLCCPEELQGEPKPPPVKELKENSAPPASPKPKGPIVVIPRRSSSTHASNSTTPAATPATTPATTPGTQPAEPVVRPTSANPQLPTSHSLSLPDWQFDMQYDSLLFRPGEIVWYDRGVAWGLSVIIRRWVTRPASISQQSSKNYIVQPLNYPPQYPSPVLMTLESSLRPWLAWSPPECTIETLRRPDLTFDRIDWDHLVAVFMNGGMNGDLGVDASILAAKMIDGTYTLQQLLSTTNLGPAGTERRWGALFLGAEKIWVGEPVRLRQPQANRAETVFVVSAISERIQPQPSYNPASTGSSSFVTLFGDLYSLTHVPCSHPSAIPPNPRNLPIRMAKDAAVRANASVPVRREAGVWRLASARVSKPLSEIKGRWYESSRLLPILHEKEVYEDQIKQGSVQDTGVWMNGRGDSLSRRPHQGDSPQNIGSGVRQAERKDALGRCVPPGLAINDSLNEPNEADLQGVERGQQQGQQDRQVQDQQQHQAVEGFDPAGPGLEEFMNLESMEGDTAMLDGPEFGGQTGAGFY